MGTINKNLFSYWEMSSMRFRLSGEWEAETVFGGSSIFTEQGFINTFTRTSDLPFGYSGTFTILGNDLLIKPSVCSIPDLEGKTITRTVKSLTSESLTLGMIDDATGREYEMDFKVLTHSLRI